VVLQTQERGHSTERLTRLEQRERGFVMDVGWSGRLEVPRSRGGS